ncbi:MAG: hypothetical protein ABIB71_00400 [Candidatus Woesearchaeota archaeon]
MLKRIKDIFRKKVEAKEVEFMELGEWISSVILDGIQPALSCYNQNLQKLNVSLDSLESVDVSKQRVEDKLKVMIKGNKPAYITAVRNFSKKISIPEKITARNLNIFCENFEEALKDFSRRTVRNYSVMKTIIGKELDTVALALKGLDRSVGEIKSQIPKVKEIEEVSSKLTDIYSYLDEKDKKLKTLEEHRVSLMQKERLSHEDIKALRESKIFAELESLKAEKQDIGEKMQYLRNDFNSKMAVLQRPLRKLSKLDVLKKTDGYAAQPFETLIGDEEMEINAIITSLKDSMERGKIDVKSTAAVSSVLTELTHPFIERTRQRYVKLKIRLREVESDIGQNRFEEKEKKLLAEFKELEAKLATVNSEIDRLRHRKVSEDISAIGQELKSIIGHKVVVKNAPVD